LIKGSPGYHGHFSFYDDENRTRLTDLVQIHILELPKLRDSVPDGKDKALREWLGFIGARKESEMEELAKKNEYIYEAMEIVKGFSMDDRMRMVAEARDDAIRSEKGRLDFASKEGLEKGIEQGWAQGRSEGLASVAQKMKGMGMAPTVIAQATGLPLEEIEKL
jgi:predicted transposase/invertase (TIGR01784 family)